MGSKISSQSQALTGQVAAESLLRNETADSTADIVPSIPKKKLDSSYELNLSETAQSLLSSALPVVSTPDEAQIQINLIKSAAQQSASTVLNSHKPNFQTAIDLLA